MNRMKRSTKIILAIILAIAFYIGNATGPIREELKNPPIQTPYYP